MIRLKFRYDPNCYVDISTFKSTSDYEIKFIKNNEAFPFLLLRFRPYFKEMRFSYNIFEVRCTSKSGDAFIAIYRDFKKGYSYIIRKKQKKQQILFARMNGVVFDNKFNKEGNIYKCFYNGEITDNKDLIEDFLQRRKTKPFNEQEYINSLTEEELELYNQQRIIDSVTEKYGKQHGLSLEQIDNLSSHIFCLESDNLYKKQILESTDYACIEKIIDALVEQGACEFKYSSIIVEDNEQDKEYVIGENYVFLGSNVEPIYLNGFQDDIVKYLYWFFLDNYEEVKKYFNNSVRIIKESIDSCLPFFLKFMEDN